MRVMGSPQEIASEVLLSATKSNGATCSASPSELESVSARPRHRSRSAAEDAAARTEDDPAAEHARESAEPAVEGLRVRTVHGEDQQGARDRDADTIGD